MTGLDLLTQGFEVSLTLVSCLEPAWPALRRYWRLPCFDRRFRPTSEAPRARFEWLAAAVLSGCGMEPVELYYCGGRYYVLDGRHRIAVARALGERSICANVTEVRLNKPVDLVVHQNDQ